VAPQLGGFMNQLSSATAQVQNVFAAIQGSHSKYLSQSSGQRAILIEPGSVCATAGI
jgi:hypothetical protein